MKRCIERKISLLGLLLAAFQAWAQQPVRNATRPHVALHAGPLYTLAGTNDKTIDGKTPVFPDLQILLDPSDHPEAITPATLHLSVDGKDCGAATIVQPFVSADHGTAAAVVIDVSGSMRGAPINSVRAGLLRFVSNAGTQDHIAIETVANDARWDAAWGGTSPQLKTALQNLAVRGNLTRLWDSLMAALNSFPDKPLAKRIIVISDGHDEGSEHTEAQVIAAAVSQHVPVDSIGVTRSDQSYLGSLNRLAQSTGGHFRSAANAQQLEQFVGSGIKVLHNLPLASFHAKDIKSDGKPHRFSIAWRNNGQDVVANMTAAVPDIEEIWNNPWSWGAAVAAISLLLGGALLLRRKPKLHNELAPVPAALVSPPDDSKSVPPIPRRFRQAPLSAQPPSAPELVASQPSFVSAKTQIVPHFLSPSADQPSAWLYCETGAATGTEFPIDKSEFWIGALDNNHLRIADDVTVSANHACVVFEHGVLGIFDHNSTNGTRVNEELVGGTRHLLRPGDRIRVGRSTFVLQAAQFRTARV